MAEKKLRESDIEDRVTRYAQSKGFLVYKFTSPARRGVPDRLFIAPNGFHFYIEFKAPGAKPTPVQEREHARMRTNKCEVYVCDDVDTGKFIVNIHA